LVNGTAAKESPVTTTPLNWISVRVSAWAIPWLASNTAVEVKRKDLRMFIGAKGIRGDMCGGPDGPGFGPAGRVE
jgi:hypothetical protein